MSIHQTTTLWSIRTIDETDILVFADNEHDALDQAAFATGCLPGENTLNR